ncbi:unnamed protein product [Didymodactylos carnosus]|uniref:Uncharacterized protein n=1 Tax=Didymodactylos carnosus TaxID=1234261 RepID=A0A814J9G7_9BILA|nr:unnamed protein product [Didymodactylos carnosus]CAF3805841.1 unnamed protein product [Didymodactylos carnosus]
MIRSLSILKPAETITLYSITVTSRQVLGWIALHEQFIGNKIIAHIVSCTAILFVLHGDGFRFNIFLLGSVMATSSGALKTIFDVILKGIIKDLTNHKLILLMTSICLFGTLLFWPFLLITHFSNIEPFGLYDVNIYTCIGLTITALVFNLLTITIPLVYTEFSIVACLLIVIPAIGSAMIFSFIGIAIALLPKTLFLHSSKKKKQQHQQGNISAFEEIRAQRRIRNYNLYNEGKT